MSPGDDTKKEMRAIAREEAESAKAADAKATERLERERNSTRIGWALFGLSAFIFAVIVLGYVFLPKPPAISVVLGLAGFCVLLAFGGGALMQGVRLDKILTAWRKGESSEAQS